MMLIQQKTSASGQSGLVGMAVTLNRDTVPLQFLVESKIDAK